LDDSFNCFECDGQTDGRTELLDHTLNSRTNADAWWLYWYRKQPAL